MTDFAINRRFCRWVTDVLEIDNNPLHRTTSTFDVARCVFVHMHVERYSFGDV